MSKWFLSERLRIRSLVLPTDPPDRVQRIMQFVEKRIIRSIPQRVKADCSIIFLGYGPTRWREAITASVTQGFNEPLVVPWPSESPGGSPGGIFSNSRVGCIVFSAPENVKDAGFVAKLINQTSPSVLVCDSHPVRSLHKALSLSLSCDRTLWSWLINSASLGSPQSRLRNIHISGKGKVNPRSQMASLYLLSVCIPSSIYDCLVPSTDSQHFLEGELNITSGHSTLLVEPESIGYIHLNRDRPTRGAKWSSRGLELVIQNVSGEKLKFAKGKTCPGATYRRAS